MNVNNIQIYFWQNDKYFWIFQIEKNIVIYNLVLVFLWYNIHLWFFSFFKYLTFIMIKKIWTIWHSTQQILDFIEMLKIFDIKYLLDVRSTPYSAYAPQFNKENLYKELMQYWIKYLWFWEEFWARYTDSKFLTNWKVDFDKVVRWESFQKWVDRLNNALEKWFSNLCIMCTESNPLECHRFSMVSKYLVHDAWFKVDHIMRTKKKEWEGLWKIISRTHEELEKQMVKESKNIKIDLFSITTEEEQLKACYKEKNEEIWYKPTF